MTKPDYGGKSSFGEFVNQLWMAVAGHRNLVIALTLFNGWLLSMSWSGALMTLPGPDPFGLGINALWLMSLIVCTVVLGLHSFVSGLNSDKIRSIQTILAGCAMFASACVSGVADLIGSNSFFLYVLTGGLSRVGTGVITASWGRILTRYDSGVVLKFIAVSLAGASTFAMIMAFLPHFLALVLMAAIPLLIVIYLLGDQKNSCSRYFGEKNLPPALLCLDDSRGAPKEGASPSLLVFMGLSVVLGISAGLLRCVTGVDEGFDQSSSVFCVATICAAGMLLISRVPGSGESFSLFYRAIAFIAVAFIVLAVTVQQTVHQTMIALGVHTMGFMYSHGLLWVFCVIYAQRDGNRMAMFARGFFANQFGQIVGALVGRGFGPLTDSVTATASNVMIYLLLFVVIALLAKLSAPHETRLSMTSDEALVAACSKAAFQYGLTKRESEVLQYLVKGYDRGYIAELLTVSSETIKSHILHIYEKLNVHTRVELFNRVVKCLEGSSDDGSLRQ